ncbi:hypothetical protein [Bosea sp. BIWAKO-01]|uniref:hypothetical protein n=1 Tax=Bosea sp. BIWAKO-01 TaxID=506668 RepID=UPI0008534061|nr:hypothetical protein [Bosea sp. BIWAKO-01]
MKRATLLAMVLISGGLAACQTITAAEQRSADEVRCRSYGFRPGTDAFAKCLLDVDLARAAARLYRFENAGGPGWGYYPYGGRPWYW